MSTLTTIPTAPAPNGGGNVVSAPVMGGLPDTGSSEELIVLAMLGMFLLLMGFIVWVCARRH